MTLYPDADAARPAAAGGPRSRVFLPWNTERRDRGQPPLAV